LFSKATIGNSNFFARYNTKGQVPLIKMLLSIQMEISAGWDFK
jgi:hypothetical protein